MRRLVRVARLGFLVLPTLRLFHFIFMVRPKLLLYFKGYFFRKNSIDIIKIIDLQSNVLDTDYVFHYKKNFLLEIESDGEQLKNLKLLCLVLNQL